MRAAHLLRDPAPWILEDRLARSLLSHNYFEAADRAVSRWPPELFGAFRAHFAVRARLAEDVAVAGLDVNRRDYVVLGAGADTFAWRHPKRTAFTTWEVDHPASQAWKLAVLERADLLVPPNVRMVAADLADVALDEVDLPSTATWNWLGVTQYLEKAATESTLRAIASKSSATTLVVEFLLNEATCDEFGSAFRARSMQTAEEAGEPMVSFYDRSEVEALLLGSGFREVELLDADALSARYLPPTSQLRFPEARSWRSRRSEFALVSGERCRNDNRCTPPATTFEP